MTPQHKMTALKRGMKTLHPRMKKLRNELSSLESAYSKFFNTYRKLQEESFKVTKVPTKTSRKVKPPKEPKELTPKQIAGQLSNIQALEMIALLEKKFQSKEFSSMQECRR